MNPFFIAGMQRSGTTLLSVMLDRHPDIAIDGNSVVYRMVNCFGWFKDVLPHNLNHPDSDVLSWLVENDYKGRLAGFLDYQNIGNYPDVRSVIQQGIDNRLRESNAKLFGDKAPDMEHFMPELFMLIPNAKILHIVRDGRATAWSKTNRAHKNLILAGQEWVDSVAMGLHNQAMVGKENYHIIRYEDLLENPETELQKISAFLGIEFDMAMITESSELDDAKSYVKSTLDTSKIDGYKKDLNSSQLKKLEAIQGAMLSKMGYGLTHSEYANNYQPLSNFQRFWLSQKGHLRELFIGKRMGMQNRENVEVKIPFKTRLKHYVLYLGYDTMPNRVFRRVFRKRWIKELVLHQGK